MGNTHYEKVNLIKSAVADCKVGLTVLNSINCFENSSRTDANPVRARDNVVVSCFESDCLICLATLPL